MEQTQLYPRATVLEGLMERLREISPDVYLTTRPRTVPAQLRDYIVLRLPNGIRDAADTYQTAKAHVYLFARDRAAETENAWRLDRMQEALCAMCPIIHERFTADRPVYLSGTADTGFHYILMQLTVTINKKTINPDKRQQL